MSDTQVTKGGTNCILTGKGNWIRWYPVFKAYAHADDTWSLFDNKEAILPKPQHAAYLQSVLVVPSMTSLSVGDATSSASTTPALASLAKPTVLEKARLHFRYRQSLSLYRMDLHDYEMQHERVLRANKMLYDRIDPSMWPEIQNMRVLATALAYLQTRYRPDDEKQI